MMVWIVTAGAVERIGDFAQAARAVDLIDQLFNSSEKRLARTLLLLANFGKEATVEPIVGKFSQETLAEMIGMTRSRVSFFMNKFRKYNGKLEIRNSLLNVVLYDKPEIRKHDGSEEPR